MVLFPVGTIYLTRGVNEKISGSERFEMFVIRSFKSHMTGEWGDLGEEDKKENALSLEKGFRLLSSYKYKDGTKIWIITESDRSATTILFPVGTIYLTRGVNEKISKSERFEMFAIRSLKRHMTGDWGDLGEEDKKENALSLEKGFRLLSSYKYRDGTRIWVITEADRSATTVLFPDEY